MKQKCTHILQNLIKYFYETNLTIKTYQLAEYYATLRISASSVFIALASSQWFNVVDIFLNTRMIKI